MKIFLTTVLVLFQVFLSHPAQTEKGWRGIVPLHSTRLDVERLLGTSTDTCGCIYRTEHEVVHVAYSTGTCKGTVPGWNVPTDTVLEFTVSLLGEKQRFADLKLDESKYVKTQDHVPTTFYYINVAEGIKYHVSENLTEGPGDLLFAITYFPQSTNQQLRCAGFPPYDGGISRYRWFDSFKNLPPRYEKARLDNVAVQLLLDPNQKAYIIVYAGKFSKRGEAKARAEKARRYLIHQRGLPPARVVAMNGGFREVAEFELYLIPDTMPPPTPTPALSHSEVKVVGKYKR